MLGGSVFAGIFGLVPAGDPDRIPKIAKAAAQAGYAVVVNIPGTKKPICVLTARAISRENRLVREAAAADGDPYADRRTHDCGLHHALTDPEKTYQVVQRMVAQNGQVNLGLELGRSRLVCVDIDTAEQNAAFLADWSIATQQDQRQRSFTVRSPGSRDQTGQMVHKDGGHYWFSLPEGVELAPGAGTLQTEGGWTVMWAGHQVLVPPSVRQEGAYELLGEVEPVPAWLLERIEAANNAWTQRRAQRSARTFNADDWLEQWQAATPWGDFLELDGWTDTGKMHNCGCPDWTAPGDHASPESATAHDVGCSARYDTSTGWGPLYIWTDHPPEWMLGRKTWTKVQYFAGRNHDGDVSSALKELRRQGWGREENLNELIARINGDAEPRPKARQTVQVVEPDPDTDPAVPEAQEPSEGADAPFWEQRPELETLRRFARLRMVSPWATLGAVLACVCTRIGPHVVLPATIGGVASLNTFWALVGGSGGGKDAALAVARQFLRMDDEMLLGPDIPAHEVGTGQGIGSIFTLATKSGPVQFCDATLLTMTEIDSLAGHASMAGSTVLSTLRQVYTGQALGPRYADKTRRMPVRAHRYRAAVVAGVQPGRSGVLLSDSDAGTPQRWVWMPTNDPGGAEEGEVRLPSYWAVPEECAAYGQMSDDTAVPARQRIELAICDQAREAIITNRRTRLAQPLVEGSEDLRGHALLTQLKIAALLALYPAGRTEVLEADWLLAELIMQVSDRTRDDCVGALAGSARRSNIARADQEVERQDRAAERAVDRVAKNILRTALQVGSEGVTRRDLTQRLASRDREFLGAALTRLQGLGQMEEVPQDHGVRYRYISK